MCSIAGWIGNIKDSHRTARLLLSELRHRGPDSEGLKLWDNACLVHTRLSIIDLLPTGAQPMSNEDGLVWVVFNGEIYNHKELRRGLENKGHIFKGKSDTEILPHLYEEFGIDFIHKLSGMFAIAIFDAQKKIMFLVRDRFGIKPLFYAPCQDKLVFASELNALKKVSGINLEPDPQAISDYSALFYIPAPLTIFKGVKALQPGEILQASIGSESINWKTSTYCSTKISPNYSLKIEDAIELTDELICKAVSNQLESDVPLGSLLSGGIDSSLVSAAAQKMGNGQLKTYNVRFPDNTYDETWAALAVAKQINSEHQTLEVEKGNGNWHYITEMLLQTGQPFADSSMFAVNSVCKLMKKHVTVALSGDGGDEGFGGYNSYWRLNRIRQLQLLPKPTRDLLSLFIQLLSVGGLVNKTLPIRFKEMKDADEIEIIQNLFSWIRKHEQNQLVLNKKTLPVRRLFEPHWKTNLPASTRLERLSALATEVNIRLTLPNDFLFKVDIASMKESLEIRVPMLDENLMDFGLTLPHLLKVKGSECKRVLRGVASKNLPRAVANKPKMGFGIPVDKWVDANFKEITSEKLLNPSCQLREFFNPYVYEPWVKSFCGGEQLKGISRGGLYQRVIMLLSLEVNLNH